jgi:hypothetical protein
MLAPLTQVELRLTGRVQLPVVPPPPTLAHGRDFGQHSEAIYS